MPRGGDENWDQVGVEPVMLDADISGILSTAILSRRPPDVVQQSHLRALMADVDRALPVVPTEARPYFQRLRDMADLALAAAKARR